MRFPCGKLSEGAYDIITFIHTIYDTSDTPDTLTDIDTTSFMVYSNSDSIPRIVGFYTSHRGQKDNYEYNYYYKNGDTLSIVAVFEEHCCALFVADFIQIDDTLLITVQDTGQDNCDCGRYRFYVTVAIANIDIPNPIIRIVRKDVWGQNFISSFIADTSKPAVCISLQDSTKIGFKLFIDSTWFGYEICSPFINGAELLRLQPNPYISATDTNYLYLDDIILIGTDLIAYYEITKIDTLEDFENYVEKEWNLVKFRDGSSLEREVVSTDSSYVFKLTYSNIVNGSCSNYIWKPLKSKWEYEEGVSRILIHASLMPPEESTPVIKNSAYSRTIENEINVIPNPFIINSRIIIKTPQTFYGDKIKLSILNLQGREINSIDVLRKNINDNIFDTVWNGLDKSGQPVSPGSYIIKITAPGINMKKSIIVK